jgi:Arc/MetJ-type ribon-helix-helix transcriptional regulator
MDCMSTEHRKQINLRVDDELRALIDQMRRKEDPIPSVSEIIRRALLAHAAQQSEPKRSVRR